MQALLCRQSGVLQRLEEMDRETESLRRELADSTTARDQLASRLAGLQAECSSLQTQVAEQEVIIYTFIEYLLTNSLMPYSLMLLLLQSKSATSAKEQQHLHQELADLKLQLASLFTQLEMERENCRLLVDYPSSSDDSSQAHLASLSNRKSQERISANTIRILLLEEQNSELRQTVLRHARETGSQRKTEVSMSAIGLHLGFSMIVSALVTIIYQVMTVCFWLCVAGPARCPLAECCGISGTVSTAQQRESSTNYDCHPQPSKHFNTSSPHYPSPTASLKRTSAQPTGPPNFSHHCDSER